MYRFFSFHNYFCSNIESFTDKVITELQVIVNKVLQSEIRSQIKHELRGKYTDDEIDLYILR